MIAHKEKTRNNCKVYDSTIYYVEGMENEKANIVNRHGTKNRKKAPETKRSGVLAHVRAPAGACFSQLNKPRRVAHPAGPS